eukprot:IDg3090t1
MKSIRLPKQETDTRFTSCHLPDYVFKISSHSINFSAGYSCTIDSHRSEDRTKEVAPYASRHNAKHKAYRATSSELFDKRDCVCYQFEFHGERLLSHYLCTKNYSTVSTWESDGNILTNIEATELITEL